MDPNLIALVGAEFEENLSLRYLAAAAQQDGLRAEILPFNHAGQAPALAARIAELDPLLVGISVPFQTRAAELLGLATHLRAAGYAGHVTAGGHFATFEYEPILAQHPAIDSVVRHEGEDTLRELCRALRAGSIALPPPGLVLRDAAGLRAGPPRRLPSLDDLAPPDRRGPAQRILGVPGAPLLGSRGCYADCAFCCIHAYGKNAAGPRYRRRSVEAIVDEMAWLYRERGIRLFIFHDDNFFVPSASQNLARYTEMARRLEAADLPGIGLVIKCRPNDVSRELFTVLRDMGCIRAYVGIETNSDEGLLSLNRRITSDDNRRALEVFEELGIYCSFNVLIFDPEATFAGVRANLDFMEAFAAHPHNFCRAEVYAGTPLQRVLDEQGRLRGDYLAWGYQLRDPRVELLFRIFSVAWSARNFKHDGVANLDMGIRFDNEVMRHFYPGCWDVAWHEGLVALTRRINQDSVARMREALGFCERADLGDRAAIKGFTIDLARAIARSDLGFLREIKALRRQMEARIHASGLSAANYDLDPGLPWAAETLRLESSSGTGLSTELLPPPREVTP